MNLLSSNIVPKVCLFDISHGKSAQMVQEIVESEKFMLMRFSYERCSIRKGGESLSKLKVTLRIEEGEVVMKFPYSKVVYQKFKEDLKVGNFKSDLDRAVAYFLDLDYT